MEKNKCSYGKPGKVENPPKVNEITRRRFMLAGSLVAGGFIATPVFAAPKRLGETVTEKEKKGKTEMGPFKSVSGVYNVKDFGATGNGITVDTAAINRAIDTCNENGGGTVTVPPGIYLSGTVHLKSDMVFHLEAGAMILGSKNMEDYQDVLDMEGKNISQWHAALIEGHNINNIEISGRGVVNGNNVFNPHGEEKMRGPHAIFFNKCDGVSVRDIFVKDAGNYAHLMDGCTNSSLRGVTVTGGWDGIDLFDCKNFLITDCQFMTGDDSIAGGGWEKVVVSNCTLNSSCNGVRNYNGGLKDVLFTNLVITGPGKYKHRTHETTSRQEFLMNHMSWHGTNDSLSGFWFAGNGTIDNMVISNVTISGIRCPVWMSLEGKDLAMRNIQINNLTATDVGKPFVACLIQGNPNNPIENVLLSNITIQSAGGGTKDMTDKPVPVSVGDPVELQPCYGLYCRYIKDMEMHHIRFSYLEKDERPALICDNIERLELDGVRGQLEAGSKTSIRLTNIKTLFSNNKETVSK